MQDEWLRSALQVLKTRIQAFYKQHDRANPTAKLTRKDRLKMSTFGTPTNKVCKLKGAQTYGFVCFLAEEFKRWPGWADGIRMGEAANCLVSLVRLWDQSNWSMSNASIQKSFDIAKRFLVLTRNMDVMVPKRHEMLHLLRGMKFLGNPRFYSNWKDEALNSLLKQCCRGLSQYTFEATVLTAMAKLNNPTVDCKRPWTKKRNQPASQPTSQANKPTNRPTNQQ